MFCTVPSKIAFLPIRSCLRTKLCHSTTRERKDNGFSLAGTVTRVVITEQISEVFINEKTIRKKVSAWLLRKIGTSKNWNFHRWSLTWPHFFRYFSLLLNLTVQMWINCNESHYIEFQKAELNRRSLFFAFTSVVGFSNMAKKPLSLES